MLIVNADDWGRSIRETDAALECFSAGRITSVSAMVYMQDSERAAQLAIDAGVPVGLHLNLCESFSGTRVPPAVMKNHGTIVQFLGSGKFALLWYHPGLRAQFVQSFQDQVAEFTRLYAKAPTHVDGHRHKHLATNVLLGGVIPRRQRVRRGFHFWPGEKGVLNRLYRRLVNDWLQRHYRTTDYFFALSQCNEPARLGKVFALATSHNVELMTHPANDVEFEVLRSTGFGRKLSGVKLGTYCQI